MKKIIFILAFLWVEIPINAQNELDSFLKVLETSKEDSFKVKTLFEICIENIKIQSFEESRKYASNALALSEKIGFKKVDECLHYDFLA